MTIAVTKIGFKRALLLSMCKITLLVEKMKHICTFLYIGALLSFFGDANDVFFPVAPAPPKTAGPETYSLPTPRIECLITTRYRRMHIG